MNFQLGLYTGFDVSGLKGHSCSVFGLLEPLFSDKNSNWSAHPEKKKRKNSKGKEQLGRKRTKPAMKYKIS